jgi:hypothetical protein
MAYHDRPNPGWGGVVIGLMIIGVGLALFIDQIGVFDWSLSFWPFLMIALGLARFVQPKPDGTREGGWLMFIGAWLLLNQMHLFGVSYRDTWPLFLVAIGVSTMWKAVVRRNASGTSQMGQRS